MWKVIFPVCLICDMCDTSKRFLILDKIHIQLFGRMVMTDTLM